MRILPVCHTIVYPSKLRIILFWTLWVATSDEWCWRFAHPKPGVTRNLRNIETVHGFWSAKLDETRCSLGVVRGNQGMTVAEGSVSTIPKSARSWLGFVVVPHLELDQREK